MASIFPTGIDTFTNPVYTKIDGEDVVSAAHVNDLQDAIRSIQEVVAGAGLPIDFNSNNFIADDSSFKAVVEALDTAIGIVSSDLAAHIGYVLVSDPVQHNGNVIEVTAIGNLSSTRVQPALEEHQADIDAIMSGGTVEGITLDDRYVGKAGPQTMQGALTITTDLFVNGNTTLGDASDTTTINGELNVSETADITGTVTLSDDLYVQDGKKIVLDDGTDTAFLAFTASTAELHSKKDIILKLDSDDATDGMSETGNFDIVDWQDNLLFRVDEDAVTLAGGLLADVGAFTTSLLVGDMLFTSANMESVSSELHLQLDKDDLSGTSRFLITQDGDTGASLASADVLLNLDESATLVTGIHKLKSGVQESGYFGLRVISENAGGVFFGYGLNFKHELTNSPSSVTLTPDAGSFNYSNLSVVDMNQYGFFFEFDTPAVGPSKVFGTYTTVGN